MFQRDLLKDGPLVRAQGDPNALQRLGRPRVADVLRPCAADADQRAVDRADDIRERDVLWRAGQPEAAGRAALAADQARAPQLGEDVLEELCRDPLRAREVLSRDRRTVADGKLGGRTERIVGPGRQSHEGIIAVSASAARSGRWSCRGPGHAGRVSPLTAGRRADVAGEAEDLCRRLAIDVAGAVGGQKRPGAGPPY